MDRNITAPQTALMFTMKTPPRQSVAAMTKRSNQTKTAADAQSTAASKSPAAVSHHIQTLQRLDQEYELLLSTEKDIKRYLHQLKREEETLRLALEQSSTSIREQREKETKKTEDEAAARLEKALMMDFDDSSDGSINC